MSRFTLAEAYFWQCIITWLSSYIYAVPFQLSDYRMQFEGEKSKLLSDFHGQHERFRVEKDHEVQALKDSLSQDLADADARARDRHDRDTKVGIV